MGNCATPTPHTLLTRLIFSPHQTTMQVTIKTFNDPENKQEQKQF
jgi:hypothetical protein